ncbi:MAG: TRAP transporter small permease subunit [Altererythrobacter sp.]|nr:TRAP transporter small permease subunit [Altererythrobacter sp.]
MLERVVIWIGGAALITATAIDTVAVIGRHVNLPLRGSIELMQPAVLVVGSCALIAAAIAGNHARIRLLIDRLGPPARRVVDRLSDLGTALFCLVLLTGSVWLALDLWSGHETSELLGVPWRVMRLFANVSLVAVLVVTFARAAGRKRP